MGLFANEGGVSRVSIRAKVRGIPQNRCGPLPNRFAHLRGRCGPAILLDTLCNSRVFSAEIAVQNADLSGAYGDVRHLDHRTDEISYVPLIRRGGRDHEFGGDAYQYCHQHDEIGASQRSQESAAHETKRVPHW